MKRYLGIAFAVLVVSVVGYRRAIRSRKDGDARCVLRAGWNTPDIQLLVQPAPEF